MEQFRAFLKQIESNIPESDMDYYKKVTKPVYEQLMSEIESRFDFLKEEIKPSSVSFTQSQLVTGYVDIYDFRNDSYIKDNYDAIIDVNQNVESLVKNESGTTEIHLTVGRDGYLFSFLCNLPYIDFMALDNVESSVEINVDKGSTTQEVIFRTNSEFINKEKEVRAIFCSNRPQESYFDVPICRRFIDVFLVSQKDLKGRVEVTVSNLPGRILVPVWNLVCDNKSYPGSRKNQILQSEKKVIMPYGMTGEQNQFSISFENCPDNIVDALVKIKDYKCNYFFTKYFNNEGVLKLYTSDKKVWGPSFNVSCITEKTLKNTDLIHEIVDYECLEGCINLACNQTDITEAVIRYFANIFYDITKLKVYTIQILGEEVDISFLSDHSNELNMDKEYLEFLLKLYNASFAGKSIKGRVVERG